MREIKNGEKVFWYAYLHFNLHNFSLFSSTPLILSTVWIPLCCCLTYQNSDIFNPFCNLKNGSCFKLSKTELLKKYLPKTCMRVKGAENNRYLRTDISFQLANIPTKRLKKYSPIVFLWSRIAGIAKFYFYFLTCYCFIGFTSYWKAFSLPSFTI